MPRRSWQPRIALARAVDLGTSTGEALLHRGGASVTVEQRYHADPISFATGRCSRPGQSAPELLASQGYSIGLQRDDRVVVGADFAFEITASASNPQLGFDAAGQSSELTGEGFHVVVAARDWRGGPVDVALRISDGGGAFQLPPYRANSAVDLLRSSALADDDSDDSITGCLEARDNAVYDPVEQRIRYYWTLDGRLGSAWPSSLGLPAPTITDAQFRAWAGVDGSEVRQTVGDLHIWEAARMARWLIVPSRPAIIRRGHKVKTAGGELRDGRCLHHEQSRVMTRTIEWHVDGPGSFAPLDHHTDLWLQDARDFVLYQQWGEPRRAIPTIECDAVEGTMRAPYDLAYTSERDGERGRLLLNRPAKDKFDRDIEFEGMHRIRGTQKLLAHLIWQSSARWPVRGAS